MFARCLVLCAAVLAGEVAAADVTKEAAALRLVPFPKEIKLDPGTFALDRPLVLEAPAAQAELLAARIAAQFERAGLPRPKLHPIEGERSWFRLSAQAGDPPPPASFREKATPEEYVLKVAGDEVVGEGRGPAGLFYAAETLCQLIRANRRGKALPCLAVHDWPSLRWRCFQDDMTRGPSSTLPTLQLEVDLGSYLKMNMFTYYMEYQYAFKKHPVIGPKDGSLTPEDLAALVAYAKPRHVEILGNQQSFGHFRHILRHKQYRHLRETKAVLTPVKEETYQLLDDLYSEVCPILPQEMFNVCCDETRGLGRGPSKSLAEKIGVGGVYVQHIRRVHDLLRDKHGKRMMMWGDIILKHPDDLDQIPKDTIMLTWGYAGKRSFEDQIIPFAKSGYEFFVCPGIDNWSRILPNFGNAMVNIRNFVRDGVKHGTLGMLNTAWEDDGESLQGYKWHGYAWGAECAWNASTTEPEDFNRRIGAVLFGEQGDHFGRAIELLSQCHRQKGIWGMKNKGFWINNFVPTESPQAVKAWSNQVLSTVRPAIEHLEACKQDAAVNAELLDAFLQGARRVELIGQRRLDGLEATQLYAEACKAPPEKAQELLAKVEQLVADNRDALEALGKEFQRIWLAESKPYALDWTMRRYARTVAWYDALLERLAAARQELESGKPLPPPEKIGLATPK